MSAMSSLLYITEILNKHFETCQRHGAQCVKMPEEDNKILQFKKIEAQECLPFVIYADFESILTF